MANAFRNQTKILALFIRALKNSLVMASKVDRQISATEFNGDVGDTIYVRRPQRFKSTDGATVTEGQISDIEQATVPVQIDTRKKVVFTLSDEERTFNFTDIHNRVLMPAAQALAQDLETMVVDQYKYIPNQVGTAGNQPSSFLEVGVVKQKLAELGVPLMDISAFYTPGTSLKIADAIKATPNEGLAKSAIENALIKRIAGMELYECQSLPLHTYGSQAGTPAVADASQTTTYAASKNTQSMDIDLSGFTASQTGVLKHGDVFTIASVYAVNGGTWVSTGNLQQFTCLEDADSDGSGNVTVEISPPIITSGAYQTVNAAPGSGALLSFGGSASTAYRQNVAFQKNAITLAFAQIAKAEEGTGVKQERMNHDGFSFLYSIGTDIRTRKTEYILEFMAGVKTQNPLFGVRTTE